MKSKTGFTLLETAILVTFFALLTTLLVVQKFNLDAMNRDNIRKTAINAMYYSLENDFYLKNNYYPESISAQNLSSVAPELFTDPSGNPLGDGKSDYYYQPANCEQGRCKEYTLSARLEKEGTYEKTNKSH